MNIIKKIAGYNLLLLLIYTIAIRFSFTGNEKSLGILIVSAIVISIHVLINLIICLIYYSTGKKELGKAFLLSSGIVLLIGFSSCWGNASL